MTKKTILFYLSTLLIVYLTLFFVLLIAVCAAAVLRSYIRSQNRIVRHENKNIDKFERRVEDNKVRTLQWAVSYAKTYFDFVTCIFINGQRNSKNIVVVRISNFHRESFLAGKKHSVSFAYCRFERESHIRRSNLFTVMMVYI